MRITDKMQDELVEVVENFTYVSDSDQFGKREAWYLSLIHI